MRTTAKESSIFSLTTLQAAISKSFKGLQLQHRDYRYNKMFV